MQQGLEKFWAQESSSLWKTIQVILVSAKQQYSPNLAIQQCLLTFVYKIMIDQIIPPQRWGNRLENSKPLILQLIHPFSSPLS